jgi:hypothetical protein
MSPEKDQKSCQYDGGGSYMQTTYGPQRSRSMLAPAMKNLLCIVGIMRMPFSKTEFNEQLINVQTFHPGEANLEDLTQHDGQ